MLDLFYLALLSAAAQQSGLFSGSDKLRPLAPDACTVPSSIGSPDHLHLQLSGCVVSPHLCSD